MSFKPKSYEEALAKKLARKPKTAPKRTKLRKVGKVTKKGYFKELLAQNKWVNKIPPGGHGSTPLQKKLWRLVTDYVRIRDFTKWGTCISCNTRFNNWNDAQGGHYRAYSKCKGWRKFCFKNVFAQCSFCNSRMNDDKFEGGRIFAENIVKRYGQDLLDTINQYPKGLPEKLEIDMVLSMMYEIVRMMRWLDIKPDYFEDIIYDEQLLRHID